MMKKYISIILITLVVAGSSCKKTYLSELAVNPNTPASTTPGLQLSGALVATANNTIGTSNNMYLLWDNFYSYSTGFQPSPSLLQYAITTGTFDKFSPTFAIISNFNAILTSTTEPYFVAIAKIMIAYNYQQLVDQYNNVPYSQALGGITNLTPAYDSGSAIYDDLLKQLDAAIVLINSAPATATVPGKYDIMYGAASATTMKKWVAFANTLKLRLAVRQSSNPTVFAAKKAALVASINATSALGYITTASEGQVNPGYTNTDPLQSPLDLAYGFKASGGTQTNSPVYQANSYAVNFFIGTGTPLAPTDPRLFAIYAPSTSTAAGGQVAATALGQTTAPKVSGVNVTPSKFSAFEFSPTKSAPLLAAAESWFLQAEAIKAGILTPTATAPDEATCYNNGVTASFIEDGLTAAQAATYLANAAFAYPTAASTDVREQAIITQKWASLDPNGPLEAYTELRRTGYPAVPLSILPGSTATTYVSRMLYPTTEYNTNAANVLGQGTIDLFTSKIFWAK